MATIQEAKYQRILMYNDDRIKTLFGPNLSFQSLCVIPSILASNENLWWNTGEFGERDMRDCFCVILLRVFSLMWVIAMNWNYQRLLSLYSILANNIFFWYCCCCCSRWWIIKKTYAYRICYFKRQTKTNKILWNECYAPSLLSVIRPKSLFPFLLWEKRRKTEQRLILYHLQT